MLFPTTLPGPVAVAVLLATPSTPGYDEVVTAVPVAEEFEVARVVR